MIWTTGGCSELEGLTAPEAARALGAGGRGSATRAMNEENWLGLGRVRRRLENSRRQLEQGVSQPRRKTFFSWEMFSGMACLPVAASVWSPAPKCLHRAAARFLQCCGWLLLASDWRSIVAT